MEDSTGIKIFLSNSIILKCPHTLWILDHIAR